MTWLDILNNNLKTIIFTIFLGGGIVFGAVNFKEILQTTERVAIEFAKKQCF